MASDAPEANLTSPLDAMNELELDEADDTVMAPVRAASPEAPPDVMLMPPPTESDLDSFKAAPAAIVMLAPL